MNPSGSQDNNLVSLYETDSGTPGAPKIISYGVLDASDPKYTGALKITSKAHDIVVSVDTIHGGTETCLDINNECQNIVVQCRQFYCARSEYVATVKGGSCNVRLEGTVVGYPRKGCMVNWGDWSDQSSKISNGLVLALNGSSPITYRRLNASNVSFDSPANYKCVLAIPFGKLGIAVVWFVWRLLKKLHLA